VVHTYYRLLHVRADLINVLHTNLTRFVKMSSLSLGHLLAIIILLTLIGPELVNGRIFVNRDSDTKKTKCLERSDADSLRLEDCVSGKNTQNWNFNKDGTIVSKKGTNKCLVGTVQGYAIIDNCNKTNDYHKWTLTSDGQLKNKGLSCCNGCLYRSNPYVADVTLCKDNNDAYKWEDKV